MHELDYVAQGVIREQKLPLADASHKINRLVCRHLSCPGIFQQGFDTKALRATFLPFDLLRIEVE